MADRPGPYVPLSLTFHTGKTGAAIQDRFGVAGLGIWASMMASADHGLILFRHAEDWLAIGITNPPDFTLDEFLTFLGHRKQTRRTRQGHAQYVELTRWEDWNNTRKRELARRRKSRYRAQKKWDTRWDNGVPSSVPSGGTGESAEAELETEDKPKAVDLLPTTDEPEWAAEDEERPLDFIPELKEVG